MIARLLKEGRELLNDITDIPQYESEILLAYALKLPRTALWSIDDKVIDVNQEQTFLILLKRRQKGEPIAYITGKKEFWSLDLTVTPEVLIPRPETELVIELALEKLDSSLKIVADLGTGSGAIALALAKERPKWQIYATDISGEALNIAQKNSVHHQLQNIVFKKGDWLNALPAHQFDLIISNPPYIAENDEHLKTLTHEPLLALHSGEDGLNAIRVIIENAKKFLACGGFLILEHGYNQAAQVQQLFAEQNYQNCISVKDISGQPRASLATRPFNQN